MHLNKGPELWKKAKQIIPGGNQLLSKRSEQFLPDLWPSYYQRAKGDEVWDLDGNHFIDMCIMGIGACPLGYADDDVDSAVTEAIKNGSMCTLNCPEEVELAEVLIKLHPWAEMVRYTRCGGEAMAVAVRIARAQTGKDKIAFCGYHGWHDWYLSANLANDRALDGHLLPGLDPSGVPRGLLGTSLPFRYNHPEELRAIQSQNSNELAAIVMEPTKDHEPDPGFLKEVREVAEESGAVLIIDEVSAGFRLTTGGAHMLYNLKPDIAVFAKAMSNGYPMAAIIGKEDTMQAAQDTFISSTYWTERIGPVAALATIAKYQRCNVPDQLIQSGRKVQEGWKKAAAVAGLELDVGGIPPLSHFSFKCDQSLAAQTLFTQNMLKKGFLAGKSYDASYAHTDAHIQRYLDETGDTMISISKALDKGTLMSMLKGPAAHSGFHRLT
ncbi:MAG: aminotransferase class III-fold pyridoxal phosphate-dependent enzyme [Methanoregula sp.]|nr:MAG: aminotransferase class III-fold pyridoxal phosphate-dependent enzyme [Methanoregula sp.]